MKIESDVFANNAEIPATYTCNGQGLRPALKISGVPKNAKGLALIVDDPDAPGGDFVHWLIWNISPGTSVIGENFSGATEGNTSAGRPGWYPPCPLSGIHHYNFKLYALDAILAIPNSSDKIDLLNAMEGHIIENTILTGLYGKHF